MRNRNLNNAMNDPLQWQAEVSAFDTANRPECAMCFAHAGRLGRRAISAISRMRVLQLENYA